MYEKIAEDKTPMGLGHKIILTFDDAQMQPTPRKFSISWERKSTCNFFVIGLGRKYPLFNRIYKNGYEIGNHTYPPQY
jgi:hypothetical protein